MRGILFCQGSRDIGLGHVTRSLALAREMRRRSMQPTFVVNDDPVCRALIASDGFPAMTFARLQDGVGMAAEAASDFVLTDCNEATRADVCRLRRAHPVINIAIQGEAKWYADASFLHGPLVDETPPADAVCAPMAHPRYVALGERYRDAHAARGRRKRVKNVLIAMGGGDAQGLALTALDAIQRCDCEDIDVSVVVGPAFARNDELHERCAASPQRITLLKALPHLVEVLTEADLAVLAMGGTTYEAFCVGVPAVVVCPSAFHEKLAVEYAREGYLAYAGRADSPQTMQHLAATISDLCSDHERREALGANAARAVDGNGCARIVDGVEQIVRVGRTSGKTAKEAP